MSQPRGVQLRRGQKLPPNTVSVARPSRWGNPYRVGEPCFGECELVVYGKVGRYSADKQRLASFEIETKLTPEQAVAFYRNDLEELFVAASICWNSAMEIVAALRELRGKNLACWCPLDQPCHRDVLLEAANEWELP